MTTFKVIEKLVGQYPKNSNGIKIQALLLSIISLPVRLFFSFNKGYTQISDSYWESMLTDDNFRIEKRLIACTGFDNCIYFYNLSSTDKKLNNAIRGNFFGNFIIKTGSGIFLRQFKSPKDWPNSKLIFIPFDTYQTETIAKSNSSWVNWKYNVIDDSQIDIVTEHSIGYNKILQIRKV